MCVPHIRFWQAEMNMRSTHILCKYAAHANVLTYFTFELTYVVTTYLFKYFKYAKGLLTHMRTSYIHCGLPCSHPISVTNNDSHCQLTFAFGPSNLMSNSSV